MVDRGTTPRLTRWADCAGCAAKIDAGSLARALTAVGVREDPRVLVGPATGDDAGVYRLSDDLALVHSVDFFPPVVDEPFDFGRIAAANALSDIYAMGARPLTALNLVAFPEEGPPREALHAILRGAAVVLDEAGAALVGGHSVVDSGIKYGLAVTGTVHPDRMITNAGARPGDALVLSKPLGTGVVATAAQRGRASPGLPAAVIESMTRLNRAAAGRMLEAGAHACTDVTGYGLLGHATEMAEASGVVLRIDHGRVPHFQQAMTLLEEGVASRGLEANRDAFGAKVRCDDAVPRAWRELLLDPQTSGGLLIAVPRARAAALAARLRDDGDTHAAVIGAVERPARRARIHVE